MNPYYIILGGMLPNIYFACVPQPLAWLNALVCLGGAVSIFAMVIIDWIY